MSALQEGSAVGAPGACEAAAHRGCAVLVHNTTYYLKLHYQGLIRHLQSLGFAVVCVAPRDEAVQPLESMGVTCVDLQLSRRGMNPLGELRALWQLYGIFRRLRPATVLNFSIKPAIYGSLAARYAGVPRVCSMITGLGYVFLGDGPVRRVLAGAVGRAYRHALAANRAVFFQNPDDQAYFVARGMIPEARTVVLPGTGVDTEAFAPAAGSAAPGTRFLLVARLLLDKGLREYAAAARLLKARYDTVHFSILGPYDDNPSVIERGELEQWVREGAVEYLGEADDVRPFIRDCDVFVLPSYREGLPRATLEAMAMGKPIVTTDVPGCRETVRSGRNGYLVPPRSAAALAEAMSRFVEEPGSITQMGAASRRIVLERFDVNIVNTTITDIIAAGERG